MNVSRPKEFSAAAANDDIGGYAVKVKRADGFKDQSTARFHISVGQDYHEGAQFKAAMDWAKDNFDRVIICVNDTLQRHNYLYQGKEPAEAFAQAKADGDAWITRNVKGGMRNERSRFEIVRWNQWITREEFAVKRDEVLEALRQDTDKNQAIEGEIEAFWKRVSKRTGASGDFDFGRFQIHSREYLIEECAAFSIMFGEESAADVYPGGSLAPCRLFKPEDQKHSDHGFTRLEFRKSDVASPRDMPRLVHSNNSGVAATARI